jgi:hypothetical protein
MKGTLIGRLMQDWGNGNESYAAMVCPARRDPGQRWPQQLPTPSRNIHSRLPGGGRKASHLTQRMEKRGPPSAALETLAWRM